jgi:hypothetical protein
MATKRSDDEYRAEETQRRFQAARRGSRKVGPQPMKNMPPKRAKAATGQSEKNMKWEYEVIRADDLEGFEFWLKKLGAEGWEAVSANYVMSAQEKSSLGAELGEYTHPASPMWIAVMKRPIEES